MKSNRPIADDLRSVANLREVAASTGNDRELAEILRALPSEVARQPHILRMARQLAELQRQLDAAQADVAKRGIVLRGGKVNPNFTAQSLLVSAIASLWTKLSLKPATPARTLQATARHESQLRPAAGADSAPWLKRTPAK